MKLTAISSSSIHNSAFFCYSLATIVAILALYVRHVLTPVVGINAPYYTMWVAIAFSAWYCGLIPSILTSAICTAGAWYWFLPPTHSFRLYPEQIAQAAGFALVSAFMVFIGEATRRSDARVAYARYLFQAFFDNSPTTAFIKDSNGRYVFYNHAVRTRFNVADELLGRTDAEVFENSQAWTENDQQVLQVEERTQELRAANEELRELTSRLQEIQDQERRRIARELHDSVGQLLASAAMNNAMLKKGLYGKVSVQTSTLLDQNATIIGEITKEIRTISHLLHPPLLDEVGLSSAIRWYVDGFAERSKIQVQLEMPEDLPRFPQEMELAVFRALQECLTNVHRHSGASSCRVSLLEDAEHFRLEIKDNGEGISVEKQIWLKSGNAGVGLRGMNERIRQLGGILEMTSSATGTLVAATLPLAQGVGVSTDQNTAA